MRSYRYLGPRAGRSASRLATARWRYRARVSSNPGKASGAGAAVGLPARLSAGALRLGAALGELIGKLRSGGDHLDEEVQDAVGVADEARGRLLGLLGAEFLHALAQQADHPVPVRLELVEELAEVGLVDAALLPEAPLDP